MRTCIIFHSHIHVHDYTVVSTRTLTPLTISTEPRVMELQIGEKLDHKADQGRCFICFVADARPHKAGKQPKQERPTEASRSTLPHEVLRIFLRVLGGEGALEYWGVPHTERGIVGSVVFDTLGFHIPLLWSAELGWERRRNVGYISNLAVAPGARRCATPSPPSLAVTTLCLARASCIMHAAHAATALATTTYPQARFDCILTRFDLFARTPRELSRQVRRAPVACDSPS